MPTRLLPLVILITGFFFAIGCKQQPPHATVSGHIEGCKDSIIHLIIGHGENRDIKYVPIKDGDFSWTDNYPDQQSAVIEVDNHSLQLFLENSDIEIEGKINALEQAKVTGSAPQVEYEEYMKSVATLRPQEEYQRYVLLRGYNQPESQLVSAGLKYDSLIAQDKRISDKFIADHPGSIVSVAIIEDLSYSEEPTYLDSLFRLLTPKIVGSRDGAQLKERLKGLMAESIGQPLKDFKEVNIKGDTVRLADLKGKYVLIHFWEPYNQPENTTLLRLYHCYSCKKFSVLGVYIGSSVDQWKEWVEEYKLPWNEVANLRPLDGTMGLEMGIRNISDNLLIDPNGVIIGRYLSMRALEQKLKELFPG